MLYNNMSYYYASISQFRFIIILQWILDIRLRINQILRNLNQSEAYKFLIEKLIIKYFLMNNQ